ncbi:MAG: methylmalonyl Co-A mutase-associated GTPase MeaB [Pseudomonadota bacterium]
MHDSPETLAKRVASGERRALAKAITLIESAQAADRPLAEAVLAALPTTASPALRVGLSGTPGVGKSTLIESLGMRLTAQGHGVAVLAVDPSSGRSGGSILGDKTRMERLSRQSNAFIRPSPAQNQLGGVARRTREVIRLVEAAGHDIVLVETVGVGQSETMVAGMTDVFVLLLAPAGGDELQGVKRGIMEIADVVLVNKADGTLEAQAKATCADYAGALQLMRPRPEDPPGYPRAMTISAQSGAGLDAAWEAVSELFAARDTSGARAARRADQDRAWFYAEIDAQLLAHVAADPSLAKLRQKLEREVTGATRSPTVAARCLIDAMFGRTGQT